ncbi:fructosyl amine:oxygen oxidoreductase [Patellaria atrata CBS 101060]|uniref:Fructosyl amine:oxygen oxidoreductase n=1 Tax=Patellaria atrata CBS 101060 TaxID=1346257 RepID=A0A9P4VLT0_9PEZI|nr:fructosyl amine:oxygen oxidoreductase [Patellaria atrata CBS 101060]
MKEIDYDASILIVGGGSWGLATALELVRRGHKNITVLDGNDIPSPIAAGNDLNKIMEEGDEADDDKETEYFWNTLRRLAATSWLTDPIYAPFYHPTGFIMCCESNPSAWDLVQSYARGRESEMTPLHSPEDFRATMAPGALTGSFPGWRGFWKRERAGWVFARGTMEAVRGECARLGVRFVTGPKGKVVKLVVRDNGDGKGDDVMGVETADGVVRFVQTTILTAGANADALLDFERQLRPTAWTIAHVGLTAEEALRLRDMPVPYNCERGFFIEPSFETHELKVCDEHPGYINLEVDVEIAMEKGELWERSVPVQKDKIPVESARAVRELLNLTLPDFAHRPFTHTRLCWDADTADRRYLITRHPKYPSLVLGVGGSGHGFGLAPAAGKVIADTVEGCVDERLAPLLRWRPETAKGRTWWETQGRFGAGVGVRDIKNVAGWVGVGDEDEDEDTAGEGRGMESKEDEKETGSVFSKV